MKTALCLSGQPRCIEKCVASLKRHIIDPLNCDVFIHFWIFSAVYPHFIKNWYKSENVKNWKPFTDEHALKHLNILNPRAFIIQPQPIFDISKYKDFEISDHDRIQTISITHVFSMYSSIMMANNLKQYWEYINGFKYDCVIRCRSDLIFSDSIPKECFENLNNLYISDENHNGINDQFAVSNSKNIDIYSNCFHKIDNYFDQGCDFGPEKLLKWHIQSNNINIKEIKPIFKIER